MVRPKIDPTVGIPLRSGWSRRLDARIAVAGPFAAIAFKPAILQDAQKRGTPPAVPIWAETSEAVDAVAHPSAGGHGLTDFRAPKTGLLVSEAHLVDVNRVRILVYVAIDLIVHRDSPPVAIRRIVIAVNCTRLTVQRDRAE